MVISERQNKLIITYYYQLEWLRHKKQTKTATHINNTLTISSADYDGERLEISYITDENTSSFGKEKIKKIVHVPNMHLKKVKIYVHTNAYMAKFWWALFIIA